MIISQSEHHGILVGVTIRFATLKMLYNASSAGGHCKCMGQCTPLLRGVGLQVQFFAKGPSGNARVTAEMFQDESKSWKYSFLYMDIEHPVPQRVSLVEPQYRQ